MNIGIVGSRRRLDKQSVLNLVDNLPKDAIVISGGCIGVDTWAVERAKQRGLKVQVFHGLAGEKKGHFRIRHYFDPFSIYYSN